MGRASIALWISVTVVMTLIAATLLPREFEAAWLLVTQDEPSMIADRAVEKQLTAAVAAREIEAALAANDVDLANSFVELAQEHRIVLDRELTDKVAAATAEADSTSHKVGSFARGLVTGEPEDGAGLAGTAVGDLFVVGDVRDAVREGKRMANGEEADEMILGLACVGIAVTAGTYVSMGVAAPVRVGLTVVKAARKTGRIGARFARWIGRSLRDVVDVSAARRVLAGASITEPALAVRGIREAVKVEKMQSIARVVGDIGRVEAKAGTKAALDSVKLAEGPRDVSRLARLAEAKGGKMRAILKLLGAAAITLSIASFEMFSWAVWMLLALLGFAAAVKRATERITLRIVRHRKARRERARILAMSRMPAVVAVQRKAA
jgi:hypothetical protein